MIPLLNWCFSLPNIRILMHQFTDCWDKCDNILQGILQQLWPYLPIIGTFLPFCIEKVEILVPTLGILYLPFVHDYKQQISQFSASHGRKRLSNSYLEHFCSTKWFTNLKLLYYLYKIRSPCDHQFNVKESRLGK